MRERSGGPAGPCSRESYRWITLRTCHKGAELLLTLRAGLQHLSCPSGASADARLPERNINAARPSLRAGASPLALFS